MEAYILVNVAPGLSWEIAKAARKIEGVKMAHAVTGHYDVVAYAEFVNVNELRQIMDNLQSLRGVQRTQTAIAIPPRLR